MGFLLKTTSSEAKFRLIARKPDGKELPHPLFFDGKEILDPQDPDGAALITNCLSIPGNPNYRFFGEMALNRPRQELLEALLTVLPDEHRLELTDKTNVCAQLIVTTLNRPDMCGRLRRKSSPPRLETATPR
ncbi:MAG: hypothetical protein PHS57_02615 [Alphaproteobacteria bacterium]|nr:hypothetical protein [Alphaproteobacteria bacterium]